MHLFAVSVLLMLAFPFIMTELDSFSSCLDSFSNEKPPVIHDILENSVSKDQNRYKLICQEYKGRIFFATLYDTGNKIPIFSAYKYTGKGAFTRPKINFRSESKLNNQQQAQDNDYKNNNIRMSRGHLFPSSHAADLETASSTFTLTNAVPQEESFNNGIWNIKEETFQKNMNENCLSNNNKVVAHVLTGAIPGTEKMKEKVNIPSHMWMAFCCYNKKKDSWVSQAYCATNEANSKADLTTESLSELQQFINVKLGKEVVLFHDMCK
ncbi:endonuclease domain-containing 1 protein-like [Sinocyclocheilus grahami]|uniref:endonuclease domain-containing 1 protein-like n=1 Tax=Sinocyclocheilus grahami TaxID=75366 RepID=UPI0007AD4A61|nr:PREDICTED: endonuclease domain-containing 1 protein-like [Sinocyclocheilus grahami]